MLAALAIVWLTADLSVEHLSIAPANQNGAGVHAGLEIEVPLRPALSLSLTGRAGATRGGDWRPIFEGAAKLTWRETMETYAGLRHDDRLRREGALADYRDPTGRMFVGAAVLPFRRGPLAVGASIDYERALPGANRLPSGVSAAAFARWRFHW